MLVHTLQAASSKAQHCDVHLGQRKDTELQVIDLHSSVCALTSDVP